MTLAHRDGLLKMLARISFRLGDFKLSSGASSDYYIDCRTTTLTGEGGRLTGLAVLVAIRDFRALQRRARQEQRELLQSTLKDIETEARRKIRKPGRNGQP